jgi:NAD(P)-dependent dehydrogenase (short-subunit alcohol dehydrogenase family)
MHGRTVVVTGGTKGIGREIAARFAQAGADVVVGARNAPAEPLAGTSFVAADVCDPEGAQALVAAAVERHGRLDVLVNNAGGTTVGPAATVSARSAERIVRLNLLAPLYVAQAANAVMQEQPEGGQIVNIGSVAPHRPAPGTAVYAAAKSGLTALTQALAIEWAPKVRVNQVTVGLVDTGQADDHYGGPVGRARVDATIPLGRMAVPRDIADLCVLVTSPLAGYLSGAELVAAGGGQRPAWYEALQSLE